MDCSRYLRVLGIEGAPSGIDGLREIVSRHVCRVPFENVSKLLLFEREGRGRFVTLDEFLDGVEYQDLGGTCYSSNLHLASLLRALGYQTDVLGSDMSRPDVHTCLRVRVDSMAYHVDAGYGGPFREPVRLDRLPWEAVEGADRYVLDRTADRYEMSVFRGQARVHGYFAHDPPRTLEFFAPMLAESFAPGAAFLNCLRVCRIFEDHSVMLLDRTLSIHRGEETRTVELRSVEEIAEAMANELGMPRCPWKAAVKVLERLTGRPWL